MPEVIIDDIPIQFTGKANIMELARGAGIEIPGFCYHPGLSVAGNCRMCLVEIGMPAREKDGSVSKDESGKVKISFLPKLQPACYQEPADGMVIRTNTEKVITNRKYIMEFLLANHPLDCPVCDQAGECVLQDYSFQYGFSKSRFFDKKRTFVKTEFSDIITPELNRCIHCDRCSRFTKEIAHDYAFTRTWRGNKTELAAFPGEKITHNYQGNMVDICPVGALTLTDFRFKSRVWFLKHSEGICSSCGKGCSVVYAINQKNEILRVKPKFNKDVNSYWMCDYGRLRYKFFNENRNHHTLISGTISSLENTMEKAAQLLRGSKITGIIASANESVESMTALADFTREISKTPSKTIHIDFRVHTAQIEENKSLKEGEILLVNDPYPNSEGARRAKLTPASGAMSAQEMLKNPEKLDLLIVIIDDKFAENPDLLEALALANTKQKNIILFSAFKTTADTMASVVFPIPACIEQEGTFINVDGIAQKFKPVIQPGANVKSLQEILNQLNNRLLVPDEKQMGATFT